MIAYVHEAYVLARACDRIDRSDFALALAIQEWTNIDHRDFGEVQDAGRWHDHALTPCRGLVRETNIEALKFNFHILV